jgi:hypothetical protein
MELATVLCPATSGHARHLPNTTVGPLLRLANPEDERAAETMRQRAQAIYREGRRLTEELGLALEVLDVEVLLDGSQAVVHHVRWGECDVRPFVSSLSSKYEVQVALHDVSGLLPSAAMEDEDDLQGCGRPGCGRADGSSGCSTCSEGGCHGCGASEVSEVSGYFARLREEMKVQGRMPLL